MSETTYYPYLGSGKIYARAAGAASGLLDMGNASSLQIAIKDKPVTLQDFSKPGGGTYANVSRIDTATLSMTLNDLNKTNLSRALYGADSAVVSGTATDEVVTAYKNAIVPLAHPNAAAVVVKDSATGLITYVADTDYEVRAGGIFILDAGGITSAEALKVSYTYAAYSKVEAMVNSAIILELHFEGLNEANSGKPVIVDVYRAQLRPAKALSLLGDKFADLQVDATILIDTTKSGTGVSKYFRVLLA